MKRINTIAGLFTALTFVAGCAPAVPVVPAPPAFVGSNVGHAEEAIPPDTAFVVYDVSFPLAGTKATYTPATAGQGTGWIVVIHCQDKGGVAVGVIRVEDYTPERAADARAGEYDYLLAECQQ